MGVDNNAILFVGLEPCEIDPRLIPGLDLEQWEEDAQEAIFSLDRDDDLTIRSTSEYQEPEYVIGYEVGDSGSYGFIVIEDAAVKINDLRHKFRLLFKKEAKVYLYNLQW